MEVTLHVLYTLALWALNTCVQLHAPTALPPRREANYLPDSKHGPHESTVPIIHFTGVDLGTVTCRESNPDLRTRSQ